MKIWKACFGIEFKRTCKVLAQSVVGFLFFLMLSIGIMVVGSKTFMDSNVVQKIQIGVSIPQGESLLKMATRMISNMDSVDSVADFHYLSEEEALELLDDNKLAVVIVIPESFYEDVDSGINPPAILYFNENSSLSMEMFAEIVRSGVAYLQAAESGVYATADATRPYQLYVDRTKLGDTLANMYMEVIMDREDIYVDCLNSPFGQLQVYGYYFATGALVLMLFMGILFPFLYHKRNRGYEEKLRIYGMKGLRRDSMKILIMSFFMSIVWITMYVVASRISTHYRVYAVNFSWQGIACIVFLTVALASFFNLIYSYLSGADGDSLCLLAIDIIMVLCSGMVIPPSYMPHWMEVVGNLLPLKHFFALFGSVIMEEISYQELWICIGYLIGILFLCAMRDHVADLCMAFDKKQAKRQNLKQLAGHELNKKQQDVSKNDKKHADQNATIFTYFQIQLGMMLRRKSLWLQLLFLVFVLVFVGSIKRPDVESTTMGIYCGTDLESYGHDDYDARVVQCLLQSGSLFDFVIYDDKEEMERDVLDGSIECAFAFSKDFNQRFCSKKLNHLIEYIYTPLTTKGYAARETVFSSVLAVYGEQLNKQEMAKRLYNKAERAQKYEEFKLNGKLSKYENLGDVANEELLDIMYGIYDEQNSFYNESEEIFHLECYIVEPGKSDELGDRLDEAGFLEYEKQKHHETSASKEETAMHNKIKNSYVCVCVAGILGFVLIMMNMSQSLVQDHNIMYLMRRRKRYAYVLQKYLAVSVPIAVVLLFVLWVSSYYNEATVTSYGMSLVRLLLYIVETGLYALVFNRGLRNKRKEIRKDLVLAATIFVAVGMCVVFPFFIDLAEFVPAIKILRYISPIYWIV